MKQKIRVVVADDSPHIRESLRRLLCLYDDLCVVAEAANGKEAVVQVEQARPDVLVLDLHMPVMGGLEALSNIQRACLPRPVVIMISACADGEYRSRALSLGAFALLGKEDLGTLPILIRAATQGK